MSDDSTSDGDHGTADSRNGGAADDGGDRDPFDSFDEYRDRAGDPFDYQTGTNGDGESDEHDRVSDTTRASADDPLADVDVSDEDPFESNPSAFERSAVEGIDPDEVWERLTGDGESKSGPESNASGGADRDGSDGSFSGDEGDVAEVSKHAYCEGCEHFSPPPDVTCTHPGTEILEFVDVGTVRVADCPVVAERRELKDDA